MSFFFRIFASNKINMEIQELYNDITSRINNDVRSFILTPNFHFNKFKQVGYMKRLNDIFLGVREENINGSKYVTTLFLRDYKTGEYIREELFVDKNYNILNVATTRRG